MPQPSNFPGLHRLFSTLLFSLEHGRQTVVGRPHQIGRSTNTASLKIRRGRLDIRTAAAGIIEADRRLLIHTLTAPSNQHGLARHPARPASEQDHRQPATHKSPVLSRLRAIIQGSRRRHSSFQPAIVFSALTSTQGRQHSASSSPISGRKYPRHRSRRKGHCSFQP